MFTSIFPGAFSVDYSCDFPGTDDYFSRNHALSNRRFWTLSFWAKRDVDAVLQYIIACTFSQDDDGFIFTSTDKIAYFLFNISSYQIRLSGGDSSGTGVWNHYCMAVNTNLGSSADRIKIWKNGSQISYTEFDVRPPQFLQTTIGNAQTHNIGRTPVDGSGDFDGKIAEFCMVDNDALTPSAFRSSNGKPIYPNVTWGTGGVWLRFIDSSNLGRDYSGNGNDWTVNGGLTQSTDVP